MDRWSGIKEMFHSLNSVFGGSELPIQFYIDELLFTKLRSKQNVTYYSNASTAFLISVYHSKDDYVLCDQIIYSQDFATEYMDGKRGHRIIQEL